VYCCVGCPTAGGDVCPTLGRLARLHASDLVSGSNVGMTAEEHIVLNAVECDLRRPNPGLQICCHQRIQKHVQEAHHHSALMACRKPVGLLPIRLGDDHVSNLLRLLAPHLYILSRPAADGPWQNRKLMTWHAQAHRLLPLR